MNTVVVNVDDVSDYLSEDAAFCKLLGCSEQEQLICHLTEEVEQLNAEVDALENVIAEYERALIEAENSRDACRLECDDAALMIDELGGKLYRERELNGALSNLAEVLASFYK